MITYLRMENFRRHQSTEIHFDPGAQLTLISGQNGVGKSTIIEAILYALYGETRHGKRRTESLVRHGAELEGVEVELRFVIDDSEYQVIRKKVGRSSTAVLYGEGVPLVESANAVTAAVTQILGMDSTGFKLAVYAQQKELDGLTSETPARRQEQISKLLRLDEVKKARDNARKELNTTKDVLAALPSVDAEEAKNRLESAESQLAAIQSHLSAAEKAVEELEERIAELAVAEAEAAEVEQARQRVEDEIQRLQRSIGSLEVDLAALGEEPTVPEAPDTEAARKALSAAETALAVAEEREAEAARAVVMARELERDRERLSEIGAALKILADVADAEGTAAETESIQRQAAAAKEKLESAAAERARAEAEVASLQERLTRVSELGDVCDQCGQEVDDNHRHQATTSLQAQLDAAQSRKKEADKLWHEAAREYAAVEQQLEAQLKREADIVAEVNRRNIFEDERKRLVRRIKIYEQRQDVKVAPVDVAAAEKDVEKARADFEAALARDAALAEAREWKREHQRIAAQLETEKAALNEAQKRLAACVPSDDLRKRLADLAAAREAHAGESRVVAELRTQLAVAEHAVQAAAERLAEVQEAAERRARTETEGAILARVSEALSALHSQMVTEIRPALESAVSTTLDLLSDGRFSRVRMTDEYDIEVDDAGVWRPLAELSGGETDLVALAVRLGLSELIAERHGSGGIGFLILDECFGSQDPSRRQAILSGIRNLRSSYGQILLISHVGGLEDQVDRVLEVTCDDDGIADVHAA